MNWRVVKYSVDPNEAGLIIASGEDVGWRAHMTAAAASLRNQGGYTVQVNEAVFKKDEPVWRVWAVYVGGHQVWES